MLTANSFFDLSSWQHPELVVPEELVWTGLKNLREYLEAQRYHEFIPALIQDGEPLKRTLVYYNGSLIEAADLTIELGDATKGGIRIYSEGQEMIGASVIMAGAILKGSRIRIGKGVLIEPTAYVKSPTIIGDQTEIRHGAYIRGHCLIGNNCVVGHTTEVKHTIFMDNAKAGHFAYLGDSILGNQVNLGAGTKLANLRFIKGNVSFFGFSKNGTDAGMGILEVIDRVLGTLLLGQHQVAHDQVVHLRTHEAPVGVFRRCNYRLTADIKRGIDQHGTAGS